MDTLFLKPLDDDLKKAADIIRSGGTVIFPTETVYGLGANALKSDAVKKIFIAKGRPSDNPLIVHIYKTEQLNDIVRKIPDEAKLLMDRFWPGPLTIILPKNNLICDDVTAGLDTVAVRMPSNPIAKKFLKFADVPVAAPSANLSGKPSPTAFGHCVDDMSGRVDAIINGGACDVGVESTVIDMTGEPVIYRPGDITREQIESVLIRDVKVLTEIDNEKPKSPGLKYKHYSPNADVVILSGDIDTVIETINDSSRKAGILLFDEQLLVVKKKLSPDVKIISLGSMQSPKEAEARLFDGLRKMDDYGVKVVFAPEIPNTDKWMAVHNRLYRAAGNKVVRAAEYHHDDRLYYDECDCLEDDIKTIAFVCTGNTCRSPMAEGLFNSLVKNLSLPYRALSAGIFAVSGSLPSENAVEISAENGIDISGHRAVQFNHDIAEKADIILTMSQSHKETLSNFFPNMSDKIYTLPEYIGNTAFTEVFDPFGGNIDVYKSCFEVLKVFIKKLIDVLTENDK